MQEEKRRSDTQISLKRKTKKKYLAVCGGAVGQAAVEAGLECGQQVGRSVPIDPVHLRQLLLLVDVGLLAQRVVVEEAPAEHNAGRGTVHGVDPARRQHKRLAWRSGQSKL